MAVGKNESVTVVPLGVLGAELQELGEQNVGDGCHSLERESV
jgi:hypothetical protein